MNDSSQFTSTTPSRSASEGRSRTALVLGGGGSTGNAWLIGVIAGLFEAGLDVTNADLTVGTSAGSTAAAQIAGATPPDLLAITLAAPPQRGSAPAASDRGRDAAKPVVDHLQRLTAIISSATDQADLRRRLGAAALQLDAASDRSWTSTWRAIVAPRLPSPRWPERTVLITAIDAATGDPVEFSRDSGVELVDAVAASCSSGLPYRIGDRLYLDGGYRSNAENADLATGYERVLVLSPFGGRSLVPAAWGTHLATQVDTLRAHGSWVETIFPEESAEHLFGPNGMDFSLRPHAARAGSDQGRSLADRLSEFWS